MRLPQPSTTRHSRLSAAPLEARADGVPPLTVFRRAPCLRSGKPPWREGLSEQWRADQETQRAACSPFDGVTGRSWGAACDAVYRVVGEGWYIGEIAWRPQFGPFLRPPQAQLHRRRRRAAAGCCSVWAPGCRAIVRIAGGERPGLRRARRQRQLGRRFASGTAPRPRVRAALAPSWPQPSRRTRSSGQSLAAPTAIPMVPSDGGHGPETHFQRCVPQGSALCRRGLSSVLSQCVLCDCAHGLVADGSQRLCGRGGIGAPLRAADADATRRPARGLGTRDSVGGAPQQDGDRAACPSPRPPTTIPSRLGGHSAVAAVAMVRHPYRMEREIPRRAGAGAEVFWGGPVKRWTTRARQRLAHTRVAQPVTLRLYTGRALRAARCLAYLRVLA